MKMIEQTADLAVFGASPLYSTPLVVGLPRVGDQTLYYAKMSQIFERNWLTNHGPSVCELEAKLSKYLDVRNVILVCNATVGLEIAAKALELSGEVIVPSFTFIATVHILKWLGITPIFADVDAKSHTLNTSEIEKLITPKTSGILGVHTWGTACNNAALEAIAKKHGLKLFYDSAHAFGCSYMGKMIGGLGECEIFSFHATKIFNTFEGGAITTNNDALAQKLRSIINFGFAGYDTVTALGMNGKMCESCAAMGLVNLEKLETYISECKDIYTQYVQMLEDVPGVSMYRFDEQEKNNFHYIVCEIDEKKFGITRDEIYNILHSENIIARRYFYPGCHNAEPYASLWPESSKNLPVTTLLCHNILVLPNHGMDSEKMQTLRKLLLFCHKYAKEIRSLFGIQK